jgi:hypothetical protein
MYLWNNASNGLRTYILFKYTWLKNYISAIKKVLTNFREFASHALHYLQKTVKSMNSDKNNYQRKSFWKFKNTLLNYPWLVSTNQNSWEKARFQFIAFYNVCVCVCVSPGWGCSSVAKCLPSMCKALGLIPSTAKKKLKQIYPYIEIHKYL